MSRGDGGRDGEGQRSAQGGGEATAAGWSGSGRPVPCSSPTHTSMAAQSRQQALSLGLAADQLRMYGLPIRPTFGRKLAPKAKLRK